MERVADYADQLKTLVGEQQAIQLTVDAMNRAGGEKPSEVTQHETPAS